MVSGWGILNFTGRVKSGAFCPSVKAIATSLSGKSSPSQNSIHHHRGTLLQAEPTRQERAKRQSVQTEPTSAPLSLSPCTYCFIALKMRDVILSRSGAKEKNLALPAAR